VFDDWGEKNNKLLKQILAILEREFDVAAFDVSTSKPIPQGEGKMGTVKSLGNAVTQAMLDDQESTMSIQPINSAGNPTALPTGSTPPTYAAVPGTAVTLTPAADGLSCLVVGVKGTVSATEVVTASFTNADGTVATGQATFTITQDPAELDVASFNVTTSTPVAQ
jgi:hypothetical protein